MLPAFHGALAKSGPAPARDRDISRFFTRCACAVRVHSWVCTLAIDDQRGSPLRHELFTSDNGGGGYFTVVFITICDVLGK